MVRIRQFHGSAGLGRDADPADHEAVVVSPQGQSAAGQGAGVGVFEYLPIIDPEGEVATAFLNLDGKPAAVKHLARDALWAFGNYLILPYDLSSTVSLAAEEKTVA